MPRIRFQGLMAFLHVVDPTTETPGNKLRKKESFVNYFKSRCVALYQPRKQVAVDERMVRSRHWSGIRQCIKDKPIKWGIKRWVIADSSNGYTVNFNIYIGKDASNTHHSNYMYNRKKIPFYSLQSVFTKCVRHLRSCFSANFYGDVTHITSNLFG